MEILWIISVIYIFALLFGLQRGWYTLQVQMINYRDNEIDHLKERASQHENKN